jgi:hypothetical protein
MLRAKNALDASTGNVLNFACNRLPLKTKRNESILNGGWELIDDKKQFDSISLWWDLDGGSDEGGKKVKKEKEADWKADTLRISGLALAIG